MWFQRDSVYRWELCYVMLYTSCGVLWVLIKGDWALGAFTKLRKAIVNFVTSVCPSVRLEQLSSHWTDFHEILYLRISQKSVNKIQVWLKSEKSKGYFTWRPMYIYDFHLGHPVVFVYITRYLSFTTNTAFVEGSYEWSNTSTPPIYLRGM
jgi:hypothetical protein